MAKRVLDLSLVLLLALPALAIVLLAAIAIKLDSPGPAFFQHIRIGRHKQPFRLWKLRTMRAGTAILASHEVGAESITRVGALLRLAKLDELPQLLSVLVGDMSFVGPRPCLPTQLDVIEERAKRGVYALRPGLTGPSQMLGIDMSTPKKLAERDATYLSEQGVRVDLAIISATILGRGRGDAALRNR